MRFRVAPHRFARLGAMATLVLCATACTDLIGFGDLEDCVGGCKPVDDIRALRNQTCVNSRGTLYCSGSRGAGEATTLFGRVEGVPNVLAMGGGLDHFCVVTGDAREVLCFGKNQYGQLGNGTTTDSATPVAVIDPDSGGRLSEVDKLSSGFNHICAERQSMTTVCWGSNTHGQLGDHPESFSATPIPIPASVGAVEKISSGGNHTCVVNGQSEMYCWGDNEKGQLGVDPATLAKSGTPQRVPFPGEMAGAGGAGGGSAIDDGSRFSRVYAGVSHNCARTNDKTCVCWGSDEDGQLGRSGDSVADWRPAAVDGIDAIQYANAATRHSCAQLVSGGVRCWGNNDGGQLGDVTHKSGTPVAAQSDARGNVGVDFTSVSAGGEHTCASIDQDGRGDELWCWGTNDRGQLGNGGTSQEANGPLLVRF